MTSKTATSDLTVPVLCRNSIHTVVHKTIPDKWGTIHYDGTQWLFKYRGEKKGRSLGREAMSKIFEVFRTP